LNAASWLLFPFSLAYGGLIGIRNAYYDRVPSAWHRAGVPVVSVGNLTVGGTGKTPMTIEIVQRLRAMGRRPAVLTRGYKAADGAEADEVLELRAVLPDTPVVVDADRVAGAARARREHHADCLVLDDGFQHRRIARDLDVVLIDALRPWGGGCVLPAGRLREPMGSLRRADLLVISRANQVEPARVEEILATLRRYAPDTRALQAAVEIDGLVDRNAESIGAEPLGGQRLLAVSGLGNPETFERLVRSLTNTPCASMRFPDHQRYGTDELARILASARESDAGIVVTTRKDWVKLRGVWPADAPQLARLDVRVRWPDGGEELDARLREVMENRS
jgi:tetraacyldisaccharide 4'-kinase